MRPYKRQPFKSSASNEEICELKKKTQIQKRSLPEGEDITRYNSKSKPHYPVFYPKTRMKYE